MRRGPRSLRGAMGAYALAGVLLVAALALVLAFGRPDEPASLVELPAASRWESAALDDGRSLRTLRRGERLAVPPGDYRLTLMEGSGSAVRPLRVAGELTLLDEPPAAETR